jgi:hypothetical protein
MSDPNLQHLTTETKTSREVKSAFKQKGINPNIDYSALEQRLADQMKYVPRKPGNGCQECRNFHLFRIYYMFKGRWKEVRNVFWCQILDPCDQHNIIAKSAS